MASDTPTAEATATPAPRAETPKGGDSQSRPRPAGSQPAAKSRPGKAFSMPKLPKRSSRSDHLVITVSMLIVGASVLFGGDQALLFNVISWIQQKTGQEPPSNALDVASIFKWVAGYFGVWVVLVMLADLGLGQLAAALAGAMAFTTFGYEVLDGHLIQNIQNIGGGQPALLPPQQIATTPSNTGTVATTNPGTISGIFGGALLSNPSSGQVFPGGSPNGPPHIDIGGNG